MFKKVNFRTLNFLFLGVETSDSLCNTYFPLSTSLKGISEKLQYVDPEQGKTIEIYTDETAIMYVEEATDSPIKASKYTNEERFEKFDKEKYTDEIIYKKTKKRDKHLRMTQSTISLSSNSSDDRDYTPVFMNSFSGILPGLQNPDSIKCEIEEKEKILAKILDLDKVEIPDISQMQKITHLRKSCENGETISNNDDIINDRSKEIIPVNSFSTSLHSNASVKDIINNVKCDNQQNSSPLKIDSPMPMKSLNHDKKSLELDKYSVVNDKSVKDPKAFTNEPVPGVSCEYKVITKSRLEIEENCSFKSLIVVSSLCSV